MQHLVASILSVHCLEYGCVVFSAKEIGGPMFGIEMHCPSSLLTQAKPWNNIGAMGPYSHQSKAPDSVFLFLRLNKTVS